MTLNRASKRNALTTAMYGALTSGLNRAATDPAVRVVQIRASGGHFCAGNDLLDFQQNPPTPEGGAVIDFLGVISAFPKPIVAAVRGSAVGIGTTMLLHCDLVYVAQDAKLQLPFVNLGLVPEAGSSYLLPMLCGHVRAAELLMLGGKFSGERAVELGVANAAVEDPEQAADAACIALCRQPPASLRATKRLMKQGSQAALRDAMRAEGEDFFRQLQSPEFMEAATAFFERRPPDFSAFS